MELAELFGTVLFGIIAVYVSYVVIVELIKVTPEFAITGAILFFAILAVFVGGVYRYLR